MNSRMIIRIIILLLKQYQMIMNLHKIVAKLLSTKMIKNNWIKIYLLVNRTQFKHKLNYKLIILN